MQLTGSILVVDDEPSLREFLGIALGRAGHEVRSAASLAAARKWYESHDFDVVITDLRIGNDSGLDVLSEIKQRQPSCEVLVVTAFATTDTAISAMKRGAYDYLTKPFKIDEIDLMVQRLLEKRKLVRDNFELRRELENRYRLDRMVGKSSTMQRLFGLMRKVAPSRSSVLITGESGTGKEMVARALHQLSPRASGPFVGINCGAIPEALLESELFGHVKGAFTGAVSDKQGLFACADGGTLFLDEIGELGALMQVKLLRALQERKIKPVGATVEEEFDVRVLAATNRFLEAEVERGTFRRDLYYRLNVIELELPPLRRRREDIPMLCDHLLRKLSAALDRPLCEISPAAMKLLCDYDYPGNVRELENIIERAMALESGHQLSVAALPDLSASKRQLPRPADFPKDGVNLDQLMREFEQGLINQALDRAQGVRKEAAKLLSISFRSLRYRLAKLGEDDAIEGDDLAAVPGFVDEEIDEDSASKD